MFQIDSGVDGGGPEILVSEKISYEFDARSMLVQTGGKGAPEKVGSGCLDTRLVIPPPYRPANADGVERSSRWGAVA